MKYLILLLIVFTGCKTTEWQSKKRLMKVELHHPEMLSAYCAKEFPITVDSSVRIINKTDTVFTKGPVVTIDCDTVYGERLVNVQCPGNYYITKAITNELVLTKKNTAAVDSMGKYVVVIRTEKDKLSGKVNLLTWALVVVSVALVVAIIIIVMLIRKKLPV